MRKPYCGGGKLKVKNKNRHDQKNKKIKKKVFKKCEQKRKNMERKYYGKHFWCCLRLGVSTEEFILGEQKKLWLIVETVSGANIGN